MVDPKKRGFDIFTYNDDVQFNRLGKKIFVKGRDGTSGESESVEANLLFEILKALKNKK